ncbi:hypothetical protein Tco_1087543 [Tanacetum coccineum]
MRILLQGGVVGWLEREITPFKDESCSTKVVIESNDQVDERESTCEGFSTKNKDTLCEVTPLKDESYSMKVIAECNEQVDENFKRVPFSSIHNIKDLMDIADGGLEREKQLGAVEGEGGGGGGTVKEMNGGGGGAMEEEGWW